jgi:hypothetical protein
MSFLSALTENQKEVLISLPYRAGLWVSKSDQTGGVESDERELQILSNIINGFAYEVFGSETMQIIMSETIRNKARWQLWASRLESVPEDCIEATDILRRFAEPKDITAFRNQIMEIGEAVAVAFSEFHESDKGSKLSLYLEYVQARFAAFLKKRPHKTLSEYLSISVQERKALSTLASSLGTTYS